MPTHEGSFTGEWSSGTTFDVTTSVSSNANRYLKCFVHLFSSSVTADTVVWDPAGANESLTEVQETLQGNARVSYWELVGPSSGTSLPVRVTISATVSDATASVNEYSDVDGTTPRDSLFSATYSATNTATVDVTDSATGDLVVDGNGASFPTGRTWTVGASQTERTNFVAGGAGSYNMTSEEAGASGTVTMSWEASAGGGGRNGVIMACSLNPAAGGGGRIMSSLARCGGLAGAGGIAGKGGGLAG